ncbi:MAG: DUF1844 domain-containing protein [Candidatus Omnitrophica bacterium]|nr:DUF1844 domain-containing protein [Candidatus Omnitrophota bacterium]
MSDEIKKKVDDAWKEQVDKEKTQAHIQEEPYHEPTFSIFISSISMQAMIAMGKLENPITKTTEKNLEQARFLIDTLGIIKEKTKNNLTPEEGKLMDESLYSLRMIYVEEKGK